MLTLLDIFLDYVWIKREYSQDRDRRIDGNTALLWVIGIVFAGLLIWSL
jgi:hypothetical protein